MHRKIFWFLCGLLFCVSAHATSTSWNSFLAGLKQEAIAQGISPTLFDQLFVGMQPDPRVIQFDRKQPEKRISFLQYRNTRGDSSRINIGRSKYNQNKALLDKIAAHYGVDPCVITALWGLETSYGSYMGTFSVIRSLATLAYDDRRSEFFRRELLIALQIIAGGHVTPAKFVGEWAGGTGQPQFLPSSWQKYAVDYDKDGRRDIWTSKADALASIANYMAANGWKRNQPLAIEVSVPANLNILHEQTVNKWQAQGVKTLSGKPLPAGQLTARIIRPDAKSQVYLMVFDNFDVLKTYNASTYYIATVSYVADGICSR